MSIAPGTRLGVYEVTALLGVGGMGEVYRATDTDLDREVAIKILPEAFAGDPERLARFEREAKVLASLNHPNIAAIYGLEKSGDQRALVLELVEGPTLAERIGQGALALEEALPIAAQIAEALEAAHEQGVVHRALKPVNIKVTPEGVVKVLDFELAKAVSEGQGSGIGDQNGSDSPTMTAGTRMGVLTGTAAYMSPEQARGQAVDRRADIWAFGCVLYEMLTGRAAFAGDEIADVLAAVVRDEPDWSRLPGTVGPRVRDVPERCLEKDARRRWHHVADVRIEFERASRDPASFTDDTRGTGRRNTRERLFRGLAVFAAGAILAGVVAWNLKPASRGEPRPIRFSIADAIPLQWQTGLRRSRRWPSRRTARGWRTSARRPITSIP